ncbi:carbohydrate-binding module family 13 protein [Melanomma pulvis-pyrius CBS 109.77]|uniref:Alpha-galactosidase n=1 Tax=Melanomma pulvis-pyrius CBS 109.77 TaxID=1314802 RepID=A0A6A6XVS1_9PLEO|nr:carbohydrate-binding module family 13 protein [Melanomma pulvis-pyrius CBS 109.77]
MASLISLLFAALTATISASIQDPQISPTPPMGFNNWARFMCNLNETLFTETADAMLSKGLLAAGYNNINLDDCWPLKERNAKGELEWDPTLFPHGLPWLGKYLHTRGFNFGIYTNSGNMTCGWYPGSQDHEEIDAKTFESWGVDYLKVDGCHLDLQKGRSYYEEFQYRYELWHEVLTTKLKKPLIFSQSAPAYFSPNFHLDANNTDWYRTMEYVRKNGELARHSDDIKVYGNNPTNTFEPGGHWESMMNNYGMEVRLSRFQSCGFFNDPDFLIVDWPDLSLGEKKTHFALWSSFSAPLILSAWIPDLKKEDIEYLTNKDIIAVDQDALCEQATLVSQNGFFDVLTKNLANGDRLVTILNRGNHTNVTSIPIERLGLDAEGKYKSKDLWTGKTSSLQRSVDVKLRSRQTAIYRISGGKKLAVTPTGMIFNTFSLNCLSASSSRRSSSVQFAPCNADDGQVWQILSSGLVKPLSADGKCLSANGGDVGLEDCDKGDQSQLWSYGINGNLVNKARGLCLEEGAKGKNALAVTKKCGREVDSQVVALPGGVRLEK